MICDDAEVTHDKFEQKLGYKFVVILSTYCCVDSVILLNCCSAAD